MDQLLPHVTCWRALIVGLIDVDMPSEALSPLADLHAPALQMLVINCVNYPQPTLKVFSVGAPLLSSLELVGVYTQPPTDTVKSLKLGTVYYLSIFSMIHE